MKKQNLTNNIIIISKVKHRGEKRIRLQYRFNTKTNDLINEIPGRKWSETLRSWHIPYNEESEKFLLELQANHHITIIKNTDDNDSEFEKYFKEDKIPAVRHMDHINQFERWLRGQRYSERTINSYVDAIKVFLRFYKDYEIIDFKEEMIVRFNHDYILKNNYSSSYQNQVISAIKLFFSITGDNEINIGEIQRPRGAKKIPDILSREEVARMLSGIFNLKHKTILSLIYACGLRRSELLNLRINHIDSSRKLLVIKGAKGKKDRIVPMPDNLIELLRRYYIRYKPKTWLFEGYKKGEKYSETSLRNIFKFALHRARINKCATLHTLRHSYATHLLESGVDLRFIQEVLGHRSSKTTEIYTRVTIQSIEKIKSPFEGMEIE